jgi:hypothetical protein
MGKTLLAPVMEFVPWKTVGRIIERHKGDAGVRTLGCADLFRIMAFSQLTWREWLRDIEVCLEANRAKLFHLGMATAPARSTLADALNLRDWRIYHALALRPISRARALYAEGPSVLGLDAAALDKSRWQIELFFQWIKQHLRIKRFLATSENAVRSQIRCAVATYALIAIVKKELKLDASLYTCLQILSVSIFEKTEISCALQPYLHRTDQLDSANQLNLLDIYPDSSVGQ